MMESLIPINIVIGDRSYRIKVSPEHEEHVRKTVKIINEKVLEYRTSFAGKDMQDYISMVLIWYATDVTSTNTKGADTTDESAAADALKKLELQIDQLLQQA
ncbi:cell division protein ZapA [Lacibacter sediminis]|uniref:Cell division protein ZapA n=1 Tax=Lacibacter sediminis TaxID=2760713 RepID=A0A7G5XE91_9BACT|nr:cell division protein ZapA [Lacibacter sediminis]QNA43794.1 cell division protein ZapA [Lacibacter sediminis]